MLNTYLPFDSTTVEIEQQFLNDAASRKTFNSGIIQQNNSFERLSEQLGVIHAGKESDHVN